MFINYCFPLLFYMWSLRGLLYIYIIMCNFFCFRVQNYAENLEYPNIFQFFVFFVSKIANMGQDNGEIGDL